jgi:aryl-alcohol dehydrogenase-like predicted oxidoreductase
MSDPSPERLALGARQLGLGAAPLGGLFASVDDKTAQATVDRAWELGVRHFDTAPLYGSGLSEQRLGAALQGRPRDELTVSTKVGRLLRPGEPDPIFHGAPPLGPVVDFTPDGVVRSLEESLERLGLDRVDVALAHDPEGRIDEALAALDALRTRCAVGVGTNHVETALRFVADGDIDWLLLAGRYSLLDRSAGAELLPLCAARGVTVVIGGVFNSGLLAGGTTFDYRPASPELVGRTRELEASCAAHGVPLAAAALQFPLRHPAVTSIVVGARSPLEVETNSTLLALPVPEELWRSISA